MNPHPLHPNQQTHLSHLLKFLYHRIMIIHSIQKSTSQQSTAIDFNHLQTLATPYIHNNLCPKTPDYNNDPITTPTTNNKSQMTSKYPTYYPSDSSSNDDSFLCNKEESQRNLPFGDLITN